MSASLSVHQLQSPLAAHNPAQLPWLLASLGLAAVGTGAAFLGYRLREHGRLICAADNYVIGVHHDYDRDWWTDRGRDLYRKARRQGATTNEEIALSIIRQEIGGGRWFVEENLAECVAQFPPHGDTHPANVVFWQEIMEAVAAERKASGEPTARV